MHPGADARPRLDAIAAVHQHQRRLVIGHIRVHRADHADVVDVVGGPGEQSPLTSMPLSPVLAELERRGERRAGLPLGGRTAGERLARLHWSRPAWGRTCRRATARRS